MKTLDEILAETEVLMGKPSMVPDVEISEEQEAPKTTTLIDRDNVGLLFEDMYKVEHMMTHELTDTLAKIMDKGDGTVEEFHQILEQAKMDKWDSLSPKQQQMKKWRDAYGK